MARLAKQQAKRRICSKHFKRQQEDRDPHFLGQFFNRRNVRIEYLCAAKGGQSGLDKLGGVRPCKISVFAFA